MQANDAIFQQGKFSDSIFSFQANGRNPSIQICLPGASYQPNPNWFYNFNYHVEKYRGLDFTEDLFTPGNFFVTLKEGDSFSIIISTDNIAGKNAVTTISQRDSGT